MTIFEAVSSEIKNGDIMYFSWFNISVMISHKMIYMGQLLFKLQAVELESRTGRRLVIANWFVF